ncbi:hypothetical protein TWF694_008861 [Orbilia ellipsospora]|uniref:Uncharacterized protein n=1 Tax=Orbilia ellipsospora TaxID=2528407 RepID=A0AAV9XFX1_9PEZI
MTPNQSPHVHTSVEEVRVKRDFEELVVATKDKPKDLAPGLRPRLPPVIPKMAFGGFVGIPPPPPPPPPPLTPVKRTPYKKPRKTPQIPQSPGQLDMMDELKARLAKRNLQARKPNLPEDESSTYERNRALKELELTATQMRSPAFADKIVVEVTDESVEGKSIGTSKLTEYAENLDNTGRENRSRRNNKVQGNNRKKSEFARSTSPPGLTALRPLASPLLPIPEEKLREPRGSVESTLDCEARLGELREPNKLLTELSPVSQPGPPKSETISKNRERRCRDNEDGEEDVSPCLVYSIQTFGIFLIFLGILKLEVYLGIITSSIEH